MASRKPSYDELQDENEDLMDENEDLKDENEDLRSKLNVLTDAYEEVQEEDEGDPQ